MNIVFAGTPEFALPPLKALADSDHHLVAIYTQPDRPAGRGRKLRPGPVKAWAQAECPDVPVFQPRSLRGDAAAAALAKLAPDLMVVAAYGLILPVSILTTPTLGCWNIHASLLPRWRGAAPIVRSVLAGDQETGVCIMQMAAGLDTGDVLARQSTPVGGQETAGQVHDRLAQMGSELLLQTLERRDELTPELQDESAVTYAEKLEKSEADLDWRRPATDLDRQVRAFNPWPVARCRLDGQWLRVWAAELRPEITGEPGRVVSSSPNGIDVAAGSGGLRLTVVQRAGGKAMPVAALLNAFALPEGTRFEVPEST